MRILGIVDGKIDNNGKPFYLQDEVAVTRGIGLLDQLGEGDKYDISILPITGNNQQKFHFDSSRYDLVFISNPEMIAFSWEADSICQIVCEKFKVSKFEQTQFWSIYSNCISQKLNKKIQSF